MREVLRFIGLAAAILLLNASITFYNVWPTPAVRWQHDISIELAACILVGAAAIRRYGHPSTGALRWVAALWVLMILGHYGDVTAPGLYGRPINLFWDVRHFPNVTGMLAEAASRKMVLEAVTAALLVLLLLYAIARWSFGRLGRGLSNPAGRRILATLAGLVLVLWAGQQTHVLSASDLVFSTPVSTTYWRQARLVATSFLRVGNPALLAAQPVPSDLANIKGADVYLIFMESYGAVTYDRPEFAAALSDSRSRFESDVTATGRKVVSAFVESPTFGGSSWLAHVSLMSGVEARDEDTNVVLMAQKRNTMVTTFARHGYRTIALMPGLRQAWPEGAFYGFDEIYGFDRLNYHGPKFGWWTIPDQFALARVDALEPSAPRFIFFPTSGTHTPFGPSAPYQPDWTRVLTDTPYDTAELEPALARQPDLLNLGPSYIHALSRTFESLGGYLHERSNRDFVMILIGDHQPPAAVSGKDASWEVPVHVIASRERVIERLLSHGFISGMTPKHPALGHMHEFLPILFDAFGNIGKVTLNEPTQGSNTQNPR